LGLISVAFVLFNKLNLRIKINYFDFIRCFRGQSAPAVLSLCFDLQSKPENRERRETVWRRTERNKKKREVREHSRCCVFKFFTALKTRETTKQQQQQRLKWNFIYNIVEEMS